MYGIAPPAVFETWIDPPIGTHEILEYEKVGASSSTEKIKQYEKQLFSINI